jgi:hypothetical protein
LNIGVIPSIPAGIKTLVGITTAKYRWESFIPAGIKTPALFTTAKPRRESRHRRESQRKNPGGNQDIGGIHNGKTPGGFPPYRRESRHRQESQRQIPAGIMTVPPGLT